MATWLIALTIGLPWIGAVLVVICGRRPKLVESLAVTSAVAAAVAGLALLPFASPATVLRVPVGGIFGEFTFVADGLGVFMAAVATVIGALCVIFSLDYMRGEAQLGRYYGFVLLFIGAMAGLALTGSLLLLVLFWELVALCSYALIAFHADDPRAAAAGIKALIITQIGGVGLLVGVLVASAHLGSYDIPTLLARARSLDPATRGIVAFGFLAAAAAKSAQVPFHTWLPDAMEAPTPISALIHAATMVNAGVYLIARFVPAFNTMPGWTAAVMVIGLLSALAGAAMALATTDLKRVLAYSTISQLGLMFYAAGAGGVFASQFHLLSHAVFKALLFLAAGAVIHATHTREIREMGGLAKPMPVAASSFTIGALALVGIPVFNGFWSKEMILQTAGRGGEVAVLLVAAALTAMYALRTTWMVFYSAAGTARGHDAGPAMRTALIPLSVATATTWLLASPFSRMLARTLPFHHVEVVSTLQMITSVMPATALALPVVAVGLIVWWERGRLVPLTAHLSGIERAAAGEFGFEWINTGVTRLAQGTAAAISPVQSGLLTRNLALIMAAFLATLVAAAGVAR
jgi:NADH-quinone oxidoreductase subunit L